MEGCGGWPRETLTREQVSEERCWWTFLFEKEAFTLFQAGLELAAIPLPQPPECWVYSRVPPDRHALAVPVGTRLRC